MPVTPSVTKIFVEVPALKARSSQIDRDKAEITFDSVSQVWTPAKQNGVQELVAANQYFQQQQRNTLVFDEVAETARHARELEAAIDVLGQATRTLPEEALPEFLNVRELNEAAAFVQKYGPLRRPAEIEDAWVTELSLENFRMEQEELKQLMGIADAASRKGVVSDEIVLPFRDDPEVALAYWLSLRLSQEARPRLVARKGRLDPILHCSDVATGLLALLFRSVVQATTWGLCERCSTPFERTRPNKRFCKEACQEAEKQQRYRDKPPKISSSKRGRKSKKGVKS